MIINLFKNSQPVSFILAPVVIGLAWLLASQGNSGFEIDDPMPLFGMVMSFAGSLPSWLAQFFAYLLAVFQVYFINNMVSKHEVLYKNSYLPALFYMLLLVIIPPFLTLNPVLFANAFLILILDKLFRIYKHPSPVQIIFDLFFLIAIVMLFYLPSVVFLLLITIGLVILKPFSWRDWMVGVIGFTLPFFFVFVYYYWNHNLEQLVSVFRLRRIAELWNTSGLIIQGYRITLGLILFLLILTAILIRRNFYKNAIRIRKFQQLVFIFLGVAILSLAVTVRSAAIYRFSILIIPASIIISYYFLAARKKWWTELLFWSIVIVMTFNYFNFLS